MPLAGVFQVRKAGTDCGLLSKVAVVSCADSLFSPLFVQTANWQVWKEPQDNNTFFHFDYKGPVAAGETKPAAPLCYVPDQRMLRSGNDHTPWKKPQACFCHRTCSDTNPYVRVEADFFSGM